MAELQTGVIHRDQMALAGLSRSMIAHRRAHGWLHPILSDVDLVGRRRIEPLGWVMAAILHFKGFAVASHASAAAVWGTVTAPRDTATVTLIGRDAHSTATCRVHQVASMHPDDVAPHRGLPVTSPARTLVDRAAELPPMALENELIEMRRQTGVTDAAIMAAIERAAGRTGVGRLRSLLDGSATPAATRSGYERKLRRLLRAAELPQPLVNDPLLGYEADFHWPRHKLVVEFDGHQFHGDRRAFEHDRLRDQRFVAAGYRVIRITARQLDQTPYAVIARIAAALALAPPAAAHA